MTPQEAIKILKSDFRAAGYREPKKERKAHTMTAAEAAKRIREHAEIHARKEPNAYFITIALHKAAAALDKQIPKKIENEGVPSEAFIEELKRTYAFEHVGICPNCNYINIKALAIKCCCNCGQALDWSD